MLRVLGSLSFLFHTFLCERVVYRHGEILLILRVRMGFSTCDSDLMEDDDQDREGEENGEVLEALEREEEINGCRDNERWDT